MKKILIIHHGIGLGGGLIAFLGLIDELKLNYEIVVLTIFDGVAEQYLINRGVKVIAAKENFYRKHYSLFIHSQAYYFNILDELLKLKSLILFLLSKYFFSKKELRSITKDVDLIYLNSTFLSDWAYGAKKIKLKTLIHIREPLSKGFIGLRYNLIRRTIKNNCDRIVAITNDNKKRVNLVDKTVVIYDPVVKRERDEKEEITIDPSKKYFIYLGGKYRIKGFEQFVNSLAFLNDDIRIFFLGDEIISGSTPFKALLRCILNPYFIKQKNLKVKLSKSNKIINVGMTNNVFYFYKKSVALICPFSKPHAALPVLEAFSLGTPVIASNVEGMDELVNSSNSLSFKNNDARSLAFQINKMAQMSSDDLEKLKEGSLATYEKIRRKEENILTILGGVIPDTE